MLTTRVLTPGEALDWGHIKHMSGDRISRVFAEHTSRLDIARVPSEVIAWIKLLILDGIGCGLFGSSLPWSRQVTASVVEQGGKPEASVWGTEYRLPATSAALANGTFVHGFEFDDAHRASYLHLTSFVLPPALALGEVRGVSGREALAAVIAAADVAIRSALAMDAFELVKVGVHSTGTFGAIGAAVAASRVMGLGAEATEGAMGLAGASCLATQIIKSEGSHLKRLYGGRASRLGIESALLSEAGFAGPGRILEEPYGGLRAVFWSGRGTVAPNPAALDRLGKDYSELLKIGVKAYPTHLHTHVILDCVGELIRTHRLALTDIQHIAIRCRTRNTEVLNTTAPTTILDAQQSIPFGVALLVAERELGVAQLTEINLRRADILAFATERVRLIPEPDFDRSFPALDQATVEIETLSGEVLSAAADAPRGQPERPLTAEEVRQKFQRQAMEVISRRCVGEIVEMVDGLEALPDLRRLTQLLRPE